MKKLLTATTALALVGGAAFAEITISGDAELGLDYNSEVEDGMSKHMFKHEMGVDFSGSGTTDGGLSFGGSAGFDTGDTETNTGTVFVSGAFGKITIGDVDSADLLAGGIVDVGMNGIGVDDIAEEVNGNSASQVRYDNSVGSIALALSAGTNSAEDVGMGMKKSDYAIGVNFSASGAKIGLGYDNHKAVSIGVGYSTGQIAVNALYSRVKESMKSYSGIFDPDANTDDDEVTVMASGLKLTSIGVDMSYTMGASTLTLVYGKTSVGAMDYPFALASGATEDDTVINFASGSYSGMGIGFSHDLGGGASLVAGFGQVDSGTPMLNVGSLTSVSGGLDTVPVSYDFADSNKASLGLTFSF